VFFEIWENKVSATGSAFGFVFIRACGSDPSFANRPASGAGRQKTAKTGRLFAAIGG